MAYQSEAALEQQFIEQLNKQEYSTVDIPDYDALVENFKVQFEAFNAPKLDTPITDKEWERIFNLMLGKSVFQSAKILRDKFVLEREDGTKVYLSFFDQDHTKNIFQVTHQTTVVGKYVNRYDVTILVNGLPLIQVELKRRGIDIREAVNQVMRYKKHSYNGLYHFIQLFIVSNGVDTKYFANSDRELMYSLAFFWTDFNNIRITNLKDFSISFLARDHIIKMLTRYTILNDTDKILMVMRPYQVYAVEALIRQATLTNRNAYIWHTTGAGKTLTSFKTAQILAANPNIKKVNFNIYNGDTLEHDYFGDMKFRVQVANPPYSANWSADMHFMEDERFNEYGKLAPKSKADFAFVQHMVYHMDEDGRAVVLLPHGVLFRGAAEEVIRKHLIQKLNVLDAVIGLPANLFFGTGIPVCVLVLKRERNGNSDNILFIDASNDFEAGKNQNILRECDIDKIVETYEHRVDVDKYAHVATMQEIEENGFNLNIPRYVDTFEPEEEIDLNAVAAEIRNIQAEIKGIDAQLKPFFDELGLDFPFDVEGK